MYSPKMEIYLWHTLSLFAFCQMISDVTSIDGAVNLEPSGPTKNLHQIGIHPKDIAVILSGVRLQIPNFTLYVLFDVHHEDMVRSLRDFTQNLPGGLVLYQYDGTKSTLIDLFAMASKESTALLLALCSHQNITDIFKMINRNRLESYFVYWLCITSDIETLRLLIFGLEGIVNEGTKISLFYKDSGEEAEGTFSLFISSVNIDGVVRFSYVGQWSSKTTNAWNRQNNRRPEVFPYQEALYKDMEGRELKVAAIDLKGFFALDMNSQEDDKLGRPPLLGIDGLIVYSLSMELNFTYKVIRPADGYWGNPLPNGTVTGLIGLSARRDAAFSICGISVTDHRNTVVDFSFPYIIEPMVLFSRAPKQKNKVLAVLSPFYLEVWLSLLIVALSIGPLLDLILSMAPSSHLPGKERTWNLQIISFNMFRNLVVQGNRLQTEIWSVRFVFLSWYLFCLIVAALYSGMLTAVLAIPAYEKPIDFLVDLPRAVKDGFTLGVLKNSANEMIFREAKSGIFRDTWLLFNHENPSESFVPRPVVGILRVLERPFVFIGSKISCEGMAYDLGWRKFHVGREEFFSSGLAIVFPQGAPYKRIFDDRLMRLVEGGLISIWRNQFLKGSQTSLDSEEESFNTYAISLAHLQAAFFILMIGLLVSTVVLAMEYLSLSP